MKKKPSELSSIRCEALGWSKQILFEVTIPIAMRSTSCKFVEKQRYHRNKNILEICKITHKTTLTMKSNDLTASVFTPAISAKSGYAFS